MDTSWQTQLLPRPTAPHAGEFHQAVLYACTKSGDPQTDKQSKATQLRTQRDAQFDIVLLKRRKIQHAAETGWPWWDDQHLAIRREFLLPSGRAFTG